jgi:hypothetical protein
VETAIQSPPVSLRSDHNPLKRRESLDVESRTSNRTSGSTRTSLVADDHGLDPLSLHILKRTGTESHLKYLGTNSFPSDEGAGGRRGSMSAHAETPTGDGQSIANVGRAILGEVLGTDPGHKKYILLNERG